VDFCIAVACRLVQFNRHPPHQPWFTLLGNQTHRLFVNDARLDTAYLATPPCELPTRCWLVLADDESRPSVGDARQKVHGAEVAVDNDTIALFDRRQYLT
jgi:hypothetical protein